MTLKLMGKKIFTITLKCFVYLNLCAGICIYGITIKIACADYTRKKECVHTILYAIILYIGSYIGVHDLNLLKKKLRKSDKMRVLLNTLSGLYCNTFNKFNNTRARIYHMTLRYFEISFLP